MAKYSKRPQTPTAPPFPRRAAKSRICSSPLTLANEQLRGEVINLMVPLFELNRGPIWDGRTTQPTSLINICGEKSHRWTSYPSAFLTPALKAIFHAAGEGLRRIRLKLGKPRGRKDLERFAAAASPWDFDEARWLAVEWDFYGLHDGETIDEAMFESLLDHDLLAVVRRHVPIHWMFSGHRSPHLHIFFETPVAKSTASRLAGLLRQLIPGIKGEDNVQQPCRLPLSRHAENGALARYAGCHTAEQVAAYLETIEREGGEAEARALCLDIEDYLGLPHPCPETLPAFPVRPVETVSAETQPVVRTGHKSQDWADITTRIKHSPEQETVNGGGLSESQRQRILQASATIPALVNHSKRQEILGLLSSGVSRHEFNEQIIHGPVKTFVMIALGRRDLARQALEAVVTIGVDAKTRRNRVKRLRHAMDAKRFWKDFVDVTEGAYLDPAKAMAPKWVSETVEALRTRRKELRLREDGLNTVCSVLTYALTLIARHGGEATVAVEDVTAKLGFADSMTASRALKFLRERFPVLRIASEYVHCHEQARDYALNVAFIAKLIGRRPEDCAVALVLLPVGGDQESLTSGIGLTSISSDPLTSTLEIGLTSITGTIKHDLESGERTAPNRPADRPNSPFPLGSLGNLYENQSFDGQFGLAAECSWPERWEFPSRFQLLPTRAPPEQGLPEMSPYYLLRKLDG